MTTPNEIPDTYTVLIVGGGPSLLYTHLTRDQVLNKMKLAATQDQDFLSLPVLDGSERTVRVSAIETIFESTPESREFNFKLNWQQSMERTTHQADATRAYQATIQEKIEQQQKAATMTEDGVTSESVAKGPALHE